MLDVVRGTPNGLIGYEGSEWDLSIGVVLLKLFGVTGTLAEELREKDPDS